MFENIEIIVAFVTAFITYILDICSKRCKNIKDEIIPLQNLMIMLVSCAIYYYATGDMSLVVASGSPVANLIYQATSSMKGVKQ